MKKLLHTFMFLVLSTTIIVSPSSAEDSANNIGDVVNIKSDGSWTIQVTSYDEAPSWGDEKEVRLYLEFRNVNPGKEIQKLPHKNWSFYLIGTDQTSKKMGGFHRHPGKNEWPYHGEEVLAGAPYKVRVTEGVSRSFVTKQVLIKGDLAVPPQILVDIPNTGQMSSAPEVQASQGVVEEQRENSTPASSGPRKGKASAEEEAIAGYGVVVGHTLGLSGKYWAMPNIGAQVIVAQRGVDSIGINARLLYKLVPTPMGNIYVAPEVGYNFNVGGTVSGTSYGLVGGAEFTMPLPVWLAGGMRKSKGSAWMDIFGMEKAKAIGVSFEGGFFGRGVGSIQTNRLTPGFNMAGHIYLDL